MPEPHAVATRRLGGQPSRSWATCPGGNRMRLSGVIVKIHTRSHIRRSSASAKLTLVPEVVGRELARELARDARFSAAASSSAISFLVLRQQLGHSAGVPLRPPARCASHCFSSSTLV